MNQVGSELPSADQPERIQITNTLLFTFISTLFRPAGGADLHFKL